MTDPLAIIDAALARAGAEQYQPITTWGRSALFARALIAQLIQAAADTGAAPADDLLTLAGRVADYIG